MSYLPHFYKELTFDCCKMWCNYLLFHSLLFLGFQLFALCLLCHWIQQGGAPD